MLLPCSAICSFSRLIVSRRSVFFAVSCSIRSPFSKSLTLNIGFGLSSSSTSPFGSVLIPPDSFIDDNSILILISGCEGFFSMGGSCSNLGLSAVWDVLLGRSDSEHAKEWYACKKQSSIQSICCVNITMVQYLHCSYFVSRNISITVCLPCGGVSV